MWKLRLVIGTFLFLSVIAVGRGQTADDIVAKYVEATGGAEKWQSLQTLAIAMRSANGIDRELYWKKPNFMRDENTMEFSGNEKSVDIRAFDGTTGWLVSPFLEHTDKPRHMSQKEILVLLDSFGEYLPYDYKRKGYKVELIGKESADGKSVYRLKVVKASGETVYLLIDDKAFLPIKRIVSVRPPWDKNGKDVVIVTEISDYRAVGGVLFPHRLASVSVEYRVNVPMDDSGFKMPGQESPESSSAALERTRSDGRPPNPEGYTQVTGSDSQSELDRAQDPQRRADLLKSNPESDINKDGLLTFEEALAFLSNKRKAGKLLPIGATAPEWVLNDANAKQHRLSDYRGKVVVMDFWAVWCTGCHQALPWLQKMQSDLAKRGVVVVAISTFEKDGDPALVMKDRGYTYQLMLNGETIAGDYQVEGLPTIYVIGVDGRVVYSGSGENQILEQRRRKLIEGYLSQQGM
jgi:peroxiredoxin